MKTPTIDTHLDLLGRTVKDRVTRLSGVVTAVSFDLYGCIQAVINPGLDKDGKPQSMGYYDVNRLEVTDPEAEPVMPRPDYNAPPPAAIEAQHGPSEKPDSCGF